jgi:hypothetical protein
MEDMSCIKLSVAVSESIMSGSALLFRWSFRRCDDEDAAVHCG